ncbi:MAG: DUF551 domain-containing protein [candidate division Zixibacteria bacterium]|nr:DUF551 domain-containing protein [candidate division Zixibacteria bacterium]
MSDGFDKWWHQQHVSPYEGCTADHVKAAWKAGREWGQSDTVMAQPSDWISVDDRLPETGVPVICACNDIVNQWSQELVWFSDDKDWCDRSLEVFIPIVTHWQLLPQPPKL